MICAFLAMLGSSEAELCGAASACARVTIGRFRVLPRVGSPERSSPGGMGRGAQATCPDSTSSGKDASARTQLSGLVGAAPAAGASPAASEASAAASTPASIESGARFLRIGRFRAICTEDAACDDMASPHSGCASSPARSPQSAPDGARLQEAHAFLELKCQQLRAHVQGLIRQIAQGAAIDTGSEASAQQPAAAPTPSSSTQALRCPSHGSLQSSGASCAFAGPASQCGAEAEQPDDAAISMWRALGDPIYRAAKHNRRLEEENRRLKGDLAARRQALLALQQRLAECGLSPLAGQATAGEASAAGLGR